jgi:hypothetical protein
MAVIQVRDVPDAVSVALSREAAGQGKTLQEFLLDLLEREASSARHREFARSLVPTPSANPSTGSGS